MSETTCIRQFRYPEDYAAVRGLWERMEKGIGLGRSDTLEEIGKKAAYSPELFLVAESEGRIIGTVIGGYDGRRGLIYHLAVEESFRTRGLGSQLMDEVEQRLKQKGCLKCYLLVLNDNREAVKFYEQRGWSSMEHVKLFGKDLS